MRFRDLKVKLAKKKNSNETKSTFNIAKGLLAAFTRKNPILSED